MLATAAAAVFVTAMSAVAQIATQDGRALDANTRVGSGGFNNRLNQGGVTPNQIIYGNVTGGQQFRGPVLERDPGAFMGPSPGRSIDRFVASSAGAPLPYQPSFDLSTPVPFYGVARAAPPPPGTIREGFTGTYIGSGTMPLGGMDMTQYKLAGDWQAQRLGIATVPGTHTTLLGTLPDELFLEIPEGSDNKQLEVSGSPLYGIQSLRAPDFANTGDQYGAQLSLMPGGNMDRFSYEKAELRRMRGELQGAAREQQQAEPRPQNPLGQPLDRSRENPAQPTSGAFSNAPLSTGFASQQMTGQGAGQLVPPELQSSQYAELRRRLAGTQNAQYAALEKAYEANQARRAAAAKAGGTGAASQPSQGALAPQPGELKQPAMGMLNLPPLKINSLATGVRAKGLHDLLAGAEDLMRQGKFQSAIDRYNTAQQVAPNNPLVALGRANAELGAGAYRQASTDLHLIFVNDPTTLMAQYSLDQWFPSGRLDKIREELTGLSSQDPKEEMPEFLLTYLAYNGGNLEEARRHLAEAQKRSGGKDPALRLMETDWKLAGAEKPGPPADLNK
jgi:hypothetical protein